LSLPVHSDPAFSQEIEVLGRKIAGSDADANIQYPARRMAEAAIDLRRVRHARHALSGAVLELANKLPPLAR
jgi:hypothetical protein